MKKIKILFVIILAIALALLFSLIITNIKPVVKNTTVNEQSYIESEEHIDESLEQPTITNTEQTQEQQVFTETSKYTDSTIDDELQNDFTNPAQEDIKKSNQPNTPFEVGIIEDLDTNSIVITKEFKSASPSKYTFEGYGIQKAPTE
jgi:hypothetical protein